MKKKKKGGRLPFAYGRRPIIDGVAMMANEVTGAWGRVDDPSQPEARACERGLIGLVRARVNLA